MRPSLPLLAGLVLLPPTAAQDAAEPVRGPITAAADPAPDAARIPGRRPGTESWVVLLRDRSFDLATYRPRLRAAATAPRAAAVVDELEQLVRADQAAVVAFLEQHDAEVRAQWWLVNGLAIEVDPRHLDAIRAHPRVATVHPDRFVRPGELIRRATDPRNHSADEVHERGFIGAATTIAFIDSGLDMDMGGTGRPHATFFVGGDVDDRTGGGIGGSRVLANVQVGSEPPEDAIAHGTAVAGVGAGERWNATAFADRGQAPGAKIVGYAVPNRPDGLTTATTLTAAYQRIAADAAVHSIRVVNNSYEGIAFLGFVDQLALDALAREVDVVVVGMGGNDGAAATFAYGAFNMLAVGAAETDNRRVATFSSRGPLVTQPQRFYPDLIANGVNVEMPFADLEGSHRTALGTSYSAPQVAGAAAIYLGVRPGARATEVKAAILAATEDVSAQNTIPPFNTRNAYGIGYLRTDNALFAARFGQHFDGSVTTAQPTQTSTITVRAGVEYTVAAAWFRQSASPSQPSDLDLLIRNGPALVASSTTPANAYEFVRFVAPAGVTRLQAVVTARSFETGRASQDYSVVAVDRTTVDPVLESFGRGCGSFLTSAGDLPAIGLRYELLYRARSTASVLLVGASDSIWNGVTLPLDLAPFGAPGCSMLVSPDVVLGVPGSGSGQPVRIGLSVPFEASLIGGQVFHQGVDFFVPNSNALGVSVSNGVRARIGD